MRYTEAKEKSAELLRLALSYMGRHSAALNPFTYTLWYEYAAGTNPSLNAAVDGLLRQAAVVDDAQVLALCQRHVFPPDQASLNPHSWRHAAVDARRGAQRHRSQS
jgi:diguanylate cyclase